MPEGQQEPASSVVRGLTPEEEAMIERIGPMETQPPVPDELPKPVEPYRAERSGAAEIEFEMPVEAKEQTAHERLVEDVMEVLAGIYRARTKGREPDGKYLAQMRGAYDVLSDERLERKVGELMKELELVTPKTEGK